MSSPANPHESSILGICSICSYEASGEPYLGPPGPSKGPRCGHSPASGPRLGRSSAWGMLPPGPPVLRPLCALRRTGPGYRLTNEKGRCGLSTPEGGGQHSRTSSIGRDPRFHGYFLKKSAAGGDNWRVGKSKICPRGKRQFRARITHAPEGLSTPLWCGQVIIQARRQGLCTPYRRPLRR